MIESHSLEDFETLTRGFPPRKEVLSSQWVRTMHQSKSVSIYHCTAKTEEEEAWWTCVILIGVG